MKQQPGLYPSQPAVPQTHQNIYPSQPDSGVDMGSHTVFQRTPSQSTVFPGFDQAVVGQQLFTTGSNIMSERIGRGFASLDSMRYYFSVNNSYVKNKLKLLLFPFSHKNWNRLIISQGEDQEAYKPPREDINAPDLYIPVVSFITWVLVSAILLGTYMKFTPETFSNSASKGIAVVVLEIFVLKAGFYLLSDAPSPPMLVLCCWSGYKFFGVCVNLIAYLVLGSYGYYLSLIYNSLCMAFFIRGVMRTAWLASSSQAMGKYFRFIVMILQFLFPLLLGNV